MPLDSWTLVSTVLNFLASVALLASGIGLLQMKSWGRLLSIWYAGYSILITLAGVVYSFFTMQSEFAAGGQFAPGTGEMALTGILIVSVIFGLGLSLLHPVLLWYFMTRPHVVAAFLGQWTPTVEPSNANPIVYALAPDAQQPVISDNPYAAPTTQSLAVAPVGPASENALETVIPVKNTPALIAYYLGLFSLFPVLGLPLAVAAVVLGRRGLKNVRANPEVKGTAHAWVGVVCGWLFGIFNTLLLVVVVVGIVAALQ